MTNPYKAAQTLLNLLKALDKELEKELVSAERITSISEAIQAIFPLTRGEW